jgi:hypothetical protein
MTCDWLVDISSEHMRLLLVRHLTLRRYGRESLSIKLKTAMKDARPDISTQ